MRSYGGRSVSVSYTRTGSEKWTHFSGLTEKRDSVNERNTEALEQQNLTVVLKSQPIEVSRHVTENESRG